MGVFLVHLIVHLLVSALMAGGTYFFRARRALKNGKHLNGTLTGMVNVLSWTLAPVFASIIVPYPEERSLRLWWISVAAAYLLSAVAIWVSIFLARSLTGYEPPYPTVEDELPTD